MARIYQEALKLADEFTKQYFSLPEYPYMSLEQRVDYVTQFLKNVKREYRRCFLYTLYNLGGPLAAAVDRVLEEQKSSCIYDKGQPAYDGKGCNDFYL